MSQNIENTANRNDDITKKNDKNETTGGAHITRRSLTEQVGDHVTVQQWLQALSAFMVFQNTWGLILAFGTFQTYYEQSLLTSKSSSDIAWVSTISGFLILFSGVITEPLFDHGYHRQLLLCGSILEVVGLMMTYQVFLSQGVCVGLGGALLYVPSIAACAVSFNEKARPKVMGIVASGTGIGGAIYPIMFRHLQVRMGFPWAVRANAFMVLGTYCLSYMILPLSLPRMSMVRHMIDRSAFKDWPFLSATIAAGFGGCACYMPSLFLPLFAETPTTVTADLAFYLVSIVNGVSVVGRLAAGVIATKIGPIETCALAVGTSAVLLFSWMAVDSASGVIIWSIFWGLTSSVTVAMPGAMLPLLSPSMSVIGTRTGMYWAAVAIGVLVGSPIGGALANVNSSHGSWVHLQIFASLLETVSAVLSIYPIVYFRRRLSAEGSTVCNSM